MFSFTPLSLDERAQYGEPRGRAPLPFYPSPAPRMHVCMYVAQSENQDGHALSRIDVASQSKAALVGRGRVPPPLLSKYQVDYKERSAAHPLALFALFLAAAGEAREDGIRHSWHPSSPFFAHAEKRGRNVPGFNASR